MKILGIITIVIISAIGCSEYRDVSVESASSAQDQLEKQAIVSVLQSPPNGRWLVNNLHCQHQIDIRNSYEITITDAGVNNAGYLIQNGWDSIDKSIYENQIDEVINSLSGCLEFDKSSVQISNVSQGNEVFTIAFDKTKSIVLRIYNNNDISILVPFSMDLINSYQIIDSLSDDPAVYDPYTDE